MVEQRSGATMATTVLGAAANLAGNALLIPQWGAMGAAVSTLFSYILIFGVRAVHTRSMLRIRWQPGRLLAGAGLLALQCLVMERDVPLWPVWSGLCLLAVVAVYRRPLWSALRRVARERRA